MPIIKFGEKTVFDKEQSNIFRLTAKGQKIHLRVLGNGYYEGKHFIKKDDGSWLVFYCPRIMRGSNCIYCEKMFKLRKQLKATKGKENANRKALEKRIRELSPSIMFYYPILDRDEGTAKIFQTTLSVRNTFEQDHQAGIDILKSEYVISRTETPPIYYSVVRLDSANIKPLTDKEKEEVKKAKEWDLQSILDHSVPSSLDFEGGDSSDADLYEAAKEIFGDEGKS